MDYADRILRLALGFALLAIGLLVALCFVDATTGEEKKTPSGKAGFERASLSEKDVIFP